MDASVDGSVAHSSVSPDDSKICDLCEDLKQVKIPPLSENGSEGSHAEESAMEYMADLINEKKHLAALPRIFPNYERIADREINRVRSMIFQDNLAIEKLDLPEPDGEPVTIQQKVYVPCKEYPEYNFVGRILGPQGTTAKQLEFETGCKIMVRGRGSLRDAKKEEEKRGKASWEHLNDDLHVLVQCEDAPNRASLRLNAAVGQINKLLVPAAEGGDDLKRKQLAELAIMNGTYRGTRKLPLKLPSLATPLSHISGSGLAGQSMYVPSIAPLNSIVSPAIQMQADYNLYMNSPGMQHGYYRRGSASNAVPSLFSTRPFPYLDMTPPLRLSPCRARLHNSVPML